MRTKARSPRLVRRCQKQDQTYRAVLLSADKNLASNCIKTAATASRAESRKAATSQATRKTRGLFSMTRFTLCVSRHPSTPASAKQRQNPQHLRQRRAPHSVTAFTQAFSARTCNRGVCTKLWTKLSRVTQTSSPNKYGLASPSPLTGGRGPVANPAPDRPPVYPYPLIGRMMVWRSAVQSRALK